MEKKICPYCGHHWTARVDNPVRCPNCIGKLTVRIETGAEPSKVTAPVITSKGDDKIVST